MKKIHEVTDQELIRWVGTWSTEEEVNRAGYHFGADPATNGGRVPTPGEVVVVSSHGKFRRGIVASVGRLRAVVVLTTPTAIEEHRTKGYELTRSQAGGPVRFALVGMTSGAAEMVDGSFAERDDHGHTNLAPEPGHAPEQAPDHPFGSHPEPNGAMTPSDRDGELVEVRARGEHDQTQVVQGRIAGQVGGLQNTPGFYVVQHADDGTYQTYDHRVVFPAPSAPESAGPAPAAPATGSSVVAILERVWEAVRANHADLPAVVIVTGSGFVGPPRWGHFRANGWAERAEKGAAVDLTVGEMFVAGETLTKGAAHTVETVLHEAAHVLAGVRGVKDTSRQNRWHNQRFRLLAEEVGLEYTKESAHPQAGFSECLMTPGTREEYAEVMDELDRAIRLSVALPEFLATAPEGEQGQGGEFIHGGRGRPGRPGAPGAGSTTNNVKAVCGCPVPRIIRASRKVLDEGEIVCGKCREPFEDPAAKFEQTDEDQPWSEGRQDTSLED